jgi:hypothetical protein
MSERPRRYAAFAFLAEKSAANSFTAPSRLAFS